MDVNHFLQNYLSKREEFMPKKGEKVMFRQSESLALLSERLPLNFSPSEVHVQKQIQKDRPRGVFIVKENMINSPARIRIYGNSVSGKDRIVDTDLIRVNDPLEAGIRSESLWYWWRFTSPRIEQLLQLDFVQLELF